VPAAIPQMMVRIHDLERWLQDFLFPLCLPCRIAIACSRRRTAGHSHRGCRAGLRSDRGRAKYGAPKHSRCSNQHRAPQYRARANRLLSHRFSSEFSWLEPTGTAADRGHSIGAAWKWHPFAGGHAPGSKVPQFCRDRGSGTEGSNPLSSSGESANHRSLARDSGHSRAQR
jgi:hypothetical protein